MTNLEPLWTSDIKVKGSLYQSSVYSYQSPEAFSLPLTSVYLSYYCTCKNIKSIRRMLQLLSVLIFVLTGLGFQPAFSSAVFKNQFTFFSPHNHVWDFQRSLREFGAKLISVLSCYWALTVLLHPSPERSCKLSTPTLYTDSDIPQNNPYRIS